MQVTKPAPCRTLALMTQENPTVPPRLASLDLARGAAVLAMVLYHFGWNLSFLGLIENDLRDQPWWNGLAHAIAATFLILVGIGLQLAHARGLESRSFLRRLGLVTGAALLVTLGTFLVFPGQFVFFGILHAIAVASILALPFLRLSTPWIGVAILISVALPLVAKSELFSARWLIWLGLGNHVPATQDFVPLLPWFAYVLAGIAVAKNVDFRRWSHPAPRSRVARALAWAGRHSLALYLLHQPILFGGLSLLAMALAPPQDPQARGFLSSCQAQCRSTGGEAVICLAICQCAVEGLKAENLWSSVLANSPDPAVQSRLAGIARRCAETSTLSNPR